jgi:hypothetical protein
MGQIFDKTPGGLVINTFWTKLSGGLPILGYIAFLLPTGVQFYTHLSMSDSS